MSNELNPSIYVICVEAHNNGQSHGCWIDALQDESIILEQIHDMLANSPIPNATEWILYDYKDFGAVKVDDYTDLKTVCKAAQFVKLYGKQAVALLEYYEGHLGEAEDAMINRYQGVWNDEMSFAMELFHKRYANEFTDKIQNYLNYDTFRDEIFLNEYFSLEIDRDAHIFSRN